MSSRLSGVTRGGRIGTKVIKDIESGEETTKRLKSSLKVIRLCSLDQPTVSSDRSSKLVRRSSHNLLG
jgi:hypothetical protein